MTSRTASVPRAGGIGSLFICNTSLLLQAVTRTDIKHASKAAPGALSADPSIPVVSSMSAVSTSASPKKSGSVRTNPDEDTEHQRAPEVEPPSADAVNVDAGVKHARPDDRPSAGTVRDFSGIHKFSLPMGKGWNAATLEHRKAGINAIRKALVYGPNPIASAVPLSASGTPAVVGPPYPTGPLGEVLEQDDVKSLGGELSEWEKKVELATMKALELLILHSDKGVIDFEKKMFTSLEGFKQLYENKSLQELLASANGGQWPFKGYLENGGSDALFGYERLSVQPYSLVRLPLTTSMLPFEVPDELVRTVTSGQFTSLRKLHDRRRLFYIDYKCLADLARFEGRYAGACEAYFWQDPRRDEALMPLAIRVHPLRGKVVPVPPAVHDDKNFGLLTTLTLAIEKLVIEVEYKIKEEQQACEKEREGGKSEDGKEPSTAITPTAGETVPASTTTRPLLYTPLDKPAAWTLAKMAFSQNDLFWSSFYHLASTHEVIDVVYLSAVRTLSIEHPVLALISRFARNTFGVRPIFIQKLLNKGGPLDQLFPWGGDQASLLTSQLYAGDAGKIASNYFRTDLSNRNLAGMGARSRKYFVGKYGPLKIFQDKFPRIEIYPYYDDVKRIHDALWDCIAGLVYSMYESDEILRGDSELSAFYNESSTPVQEGGAGIQGLLTFHNTRVQLIDFLTHIAYLASIKHNIINTNGPSYGLNTLPYHPMSFFKPLPTTEKEKAQLTSIDDLATQGYLPDVMQSLKQIALLNAFTRPNYVKEDGEEGEGQTLFHAFDDPALLRAAPDAFRRAVRVFKTRMEDMSTDFRKRNQGVPNAANPFVWTVLDPKWVPWYAAI